MTIREAWLTLAQWWTHAVEVRGWTCLLLAGKRYFGICDTSYVMVMYGMVTPEQRLTMLAALPDHDGDYVWQWTPDGAIGREAFCRRQAAEIPIDEDLTRYRPRFSPSFFDQE